MFGNILGSFENVPPGYCDVTSVRLVLFDIFVLLQEPGTCFSLHLLQVWW